MYNYKQFTGADLPDKTLCLTYDDGPGKDTYEIASFLNSLGIRATFFMVGKYAYHRPDVLRAVKDFGHIIGNHTYDHPDLPYYVSINGNVQDQILRTDTLIKQFANNDTIYFRAPYGKWSKETADELNANALTSVNYIGPFHWDIEGIDCYYWRNDFSVEDAVAKYISNIKKAKRGIIVMHDDISDMDHVKLKNQTLALTKVLIPKLIAQGYKFIGLDEIPSVKKAAEIVPLFNLQTSSNLFIRLSADGDNSLDNSGQLNDSLSSFSMQQMGYGKVALKAHNNLYLNANNNRVQANSTTISDHELFDWIPIDFGKCILRTSNGNFLTCESRSGSKLMAGAEYMRQAHEFTFKPLNFETKEDKTFTSRLTLMKKRLLFIKSKLSDF